MKSTKTAGKAYKICVFVVSVAKDTGMGGFCLFGILFILFGMYFKSELFMETELTLKIFNLDVDKRNVGRPTKVRSKDGWKP
jgi:hypothetical protein